MACHGFESRMAAVVRDEDGVRDRVKLIRCHGLLHLRPNRLQRAEGRDVVSYQHDVGETRAAEVARRLPQYQSEVAPSA